MEKNLIWNEIWNGKYLVWNRRNFAVWNIEKSSSIPFHSMPCLGYPFPLNVHLLKVPICPRAHLHTFSGNWHRALGVPLPPKYQFVPRVHLLKCPCVNILGKWAEGTWGTPFPQMFIYLGSYLHQCSFPGVQFF